MPADKNAQEHRDAQNKENQESTRPIGGKNADASSLPEIWPQGNAQENTDHFARSGQDQNALGQGNS